MLHQKTNPLAAFVALLWISVPSLIAQEPNTSPAAGADNSAPASVVPFGGGAIADFDSLMELIQTTVVPDTWEALGGPSTMSPYAAGIAINPAGLIKEIAHKPIESELDRLRQESLVAAASADRPHWQQASELRKVSLPRLQQALVRARAAGDPISPAMLHLAGLSRIQYVFFGDKYDDVVLAGPVGGIREDESGNPVDRETGLVALSLASLMFALEAAEHRQPFGCTIEPTREGIVRSQSVQAEVHSGAVPPAAAGTKLAEALGKQEIRVFGTADDSPVALLMVEADRHMKLLALGTEPMPRGVANYLQIVEGTIDSGPPTGSFLRLWFAARAKSVRCDAAKRSFELAGLPLRLLSEQEAADQLGRRFAAAPDPRASRFAEEFTRHFLDIAREYPIYDRLRGLYDLTAIAELIRRHAPDENRRNLVGVLAQPDLWMTSGQVSPKQTDSIVVTHRFRKGRKIHHLIVASGGVQIQPSDTVVSQPSVYDPVAGVARASHDSAPASVERWWWD